MQARCRSAKPLLLSAVHRAFTPWNRPLAARGGAATFSQAFIHLVNSAIDAKNYFPNRNKSADVGDTRPGRSADRDETRFDQLAAVPSISGASISSRTRVDGRLIARR